MIAVDIRNAVIEAYNLKISIAGIRIAQSNLSSWDGIL